MRKLRGRAGSSFLLLTMFAAIGVSRPASAQTASVEGSAQVDAGFGAAGGFQPTPERWFLTLEAGLAAPLDDEHQAAYALGVNGGVGLFRSLHRTVALGIRPSYGVLKEDEDANGGGYNFGILSGVLRLRPLARAEDERRSTGLWLEAALGPAVVEDELRAALTPGLGYTFDLGQVGVGPMARYIHVIEPDAPDANIGVIGVELTFLDGPRRTALAHETASAARAGDRDGDGFLDPRDACPDQPENFNGINDHDGCPDGMGSRFVEGRYVIDERVFFDYDKAELRDTGKTALKDVIDEYRQDGKGWKRLRVQGHADSRGTEEYNEELSRNRAQAVKAFLVASGIPGDKIDVEAYGERKPAVPNADTPAEYQKNRRVEFVLEK